MTTLDLRIGRTYRAKKPARTGDALTPLINDRTVVWLSSDKTIVQYDGPAVVPGRHLPRVQADVFTRWAGRDVSDELPAGLYAAWPPARASKPKLARQAKVPAC